MSRQRVSAVLNSFTTEMRRLSNLDRRNQRDLSASRPQLCLAAEGIFFRAFRAYENFLEESFILYVLGKPSNSGTKYNSFLAPRNFNHARELLLDDKRFLDWANPEIVMARAERYIDGGGPTFNVLAGAKQDLSDMKVLRNHIAHNSVESSRAFDKLIRRIRGTAPLAQIGPGDHLLDRGGSGSSQYYLLRYLNRLTEVAESIAEA